MGSKIWFVNLILHSHKPSFWIYLQVCIVRFVYFYVSYTLSIYTTSLSLLIPIYPIKRKHEFCKSPSDVYSLVTAGWRWPQARVIDTWLGNWLCDCASAPEGGQPQIESNFSIANIAPKGKAQKLNCQCNIKSEKWIKSKSWETKTEKYKRCDVHIYTHIYIYKYKLKGGFACLYICILHMHAELYF